MKQDTRTEIDGKGIKRTLIRSSCPCCRTCWIYLDGPMAGKCIYNGPFSGYVNEKGEPVTPTWRAAEIPK